MPYKDPEKQRAAMRESARRRRAADPEKFRAASRKANRKFRAEHPEEVRASNRRSSAKYRAKNPEKVRERNLEYSRRRAENGYQNPPRRRRDRSESNRRYHEENKEAIKAKADKRNSQGGDRRGPWSDVEKAIVMREDITPTEMAYMLERPYISVIAQRKYLRKKGLL